MNTNTALKHEISKKFDSFRFKLGVNEAITLFISYWAYLQSGMYPLSDQDLKKISDVEQEFKNLTHLICEASIKNGEDDVLGWLLTLTSSSANAFAFFPTPAGVSKLLTSLMDINKSKTDIYEPCCGTGSIVIRSVTEIYLENLHKENPLSGLRIHAEDINPIACKCIFMQLLFKFQHLEYIYGKPATPDSIVIKNIDVLSRKQGTNHYVLEAPCTTNNQQNVT